MHVFDHNIPFNNIPSLEKIIFEDGWEEITGYAYFVTTSDLEIIIPKTVKKISPLPFFIHGPTKIKFLGDCPEILEQDYFYGSPTICYDPSTKGWDECEWIKKHNTELLQ